MCFQGFILYFSPKYQIYIEIFEFHSSMCTFLTCFSVSLALLGGFRSFRLRTYYTSEKNIMTPLRKFPFMKSKGIGYPPMGTQSSCWAPEESVNLLNLLQPRLFVTQNSELTKKMLQKQTFLTLFLQLVQKWQKVQINYEKCI